MSTTPNEFREPDDELEFSSHLHPLSVTTLIFGLLSFLALFKTMFWLLPILALVTGSLCLRSLHYNPEKFGRKLALWGLILATFFGAWAVSRHYSREQWLYRHARHNAEVWLDLIHQQKLRTAHQLHLTPDSRAQVGSTLDAFYAQEFNQEEYEGFYTSDPLEMFVKVAPRATIDFVRYLSYEPHEFYDDVSLAFLARYDEAGQDQEMKLWVVMRRAPTAAAGVCGWSVYSVLPGEKHF